MDRIPFIVSQIAGLVCAILATLCFSLVHELTGFIWGAMFTMTTIGMVTIMCRVSWKLDAYDVAQEDIERSRKRIVDLVGKLSVLASRVYVTREPTNDAMRIIRHQLLDLAIDELGKGEVPARHVIANIDPEAIRDVVEAQLKQGKLNLNANRRWQRELVQYALGDKKPAGEPASSK
ncbi:MAG: hypothetical protein ACYC44_01085 [Patescibacteria group bacterium]